MRRDILLNAIEMENLVDEVTHILYTANRTGELDSILKSMGIDNYCDNPVYKTSTKGKIVVIGESNVKEKHLLGIGKSFGFEKNRFEMCLDYNESKTYDYKKLRYEPYKYSAVLFGAVPHSSTGKNCSGSVVSELQNQEGYPRTEELMAGNHLKITKNNFREALEKLIAEGVIEP